MLRTTQWPIKDKRYRLNIWEVILEVETASDRQHYVLRYKQVKMFLSKTQALQLLKASGNYELQNNTIKNEWYPNVS